MRHILAKDKDKVAEQKRIDKPLLTASIANNFVERFPGFYKTEKARSAAIQDANDARHRDTTYQALGLSMPMQSKLLAGA